MEALWWTAEGYRRMRGEWVISYSGVCASMTTSFLSVNVYIDCFIDVVGGKLFKKVSQSVVLTVM